LATLREAQTGIVPGALEHPRIGKIDAVWGRADSKPGANDGFGIAHVIEDHPEIDAENLPELIAGMKVKSMTPNRVILEGPDHKGAVSLDWMGAPRDAWLLSAYAKKPNALPKRAPRTPDYPRGALGGRDGSPDRGAPANIEDAGAPDNAALKVFDDPAGDGPKSAVDSIEHDLLADIADDPLMAAKTFSIDDVERPLADILADLEGERNAIAAIRGCL
jgi:hypothetical protein